MRSQAASSAAASASVTSAGIRIRLLRYAPGTVPASGTAISPSAYSQVRNVRSMLAVFCVVPGAWMRAMPARKAVTSEAVRALSGGPLSPSGPTAARNRRAESR